MKAEKNIVILSGSVDGLYDGVCHYSHRLIEALAEKKPNWNFYLLGRRNGRLHKPFFKKNNYWVLAPNHSWPSLSGLEKLIARWLAPSILHIQEESYSYFHTDSALQLARAARCPVVTTLHEFHIGKVPDEQITTDLIKASSFVISNDQRNSDRCRDILHRKVDRQLWSGSTVSPLDYEVPKNQFEIATFGHMSLRDFSPILSALDKLKQKYEGLNWKIIGSFDPEKNQKHKEIKQVLDRPWIHFTGGFPDLESKAFRECIASSHLMILPYTDGASTRRSTLQVSWAFGLPTLTTPPPNPEEKIKDGENCLLIPLYDQDRWYQAIDRVFSERDLEKKLHQGSLSNSREMSWENLAKQHIDIYQSL